MMDRIFASMKNITYMLQKGYTFLQPQGDAGWVHNPIDAGKDERASPDSMLKVEDRT